MNGLIQKVHEGLRFACNQCDKTYAIKHHLSGHIKSIHENCQDFKCGFCGKTFGSKIKRNNHVWQSHSPVICNICNKQLANQLHLNRHKVFVHKETEGAWFCEKCPKQAFFSQKIFDKHVRTKHQI